MENWIERQGIDEATNINEIRFSNCQLCIEIAEVTSMLNLWLLFGSKRLFEYVGLL